MKTKFGRDRKKFTPWDLERIPEDPSVTEVANALHVSRTTVLRWIEDRRRILQEASDPYRIDRDALLEFIRETGRYRHLTEYD